MKTPIALGFQFFTRALPIKNGDVSSIGVTAGAGTYLTDGVMEKSNIDCHILIGKYCSIAHDVRFEEPYVPFYFGAISEVPRFERRL